VVASILVSWAVDLEADGVAVIGSIPAGLPSISIPKPPLGDVVDLVPAAIGIFLVSFADGILTARSFAGKRNQHIRANQELLAFSGMSAAAGISQGFPLGASGSRTAVNDQMGARTQIAGLVAAGAVALVLLFFTGPMSYLPKAVPRCGDRLGRHRPRRPGRLARAPAREPVRAGRSGQASQL